MKPMHVVVLGTGGLGGYFGARLVSAGFDVTFVARGRRLEALQRDGLTLKEPSGERVHVDVRCTHDLEGVARADVALVCVKSYDLEAAARQLSPVIDAMSAVVPLQNGVNAAEVLAHALPPEAILGAVAYATAFMHEPGIVDHVSSGEVEIVVGALDGRDPARAQSVVDVLTRAGVRARTDADVRSAIWEKCILGVAAAGMTALTRLPYGPILECPETRRMFRRAMEEAWAVGRAAGVALADDVVERLFAFATRMPRNAFASMYYDVQAGRRLELDAIHGAVLRLASQHAISAPVLECIYAALKPHADGTSPQTP